VLGGDAVAKIGTVAILLPSNNADSRKTKYGSKSPVGQPTLLEAASHLQKKIFWFSFGGVTTDVIKIGDADPKALEEVDALIAFGLSSDTDMDFAREIFETRRQRGASQKFRQCQIGLDCASPLTATVGPYDEESIYLGSSIPWTQEASGSRLLEQLRGLFERWTTDDFGVALMLFFNQFSGKKVEWVKHSIDASWEKGPVQNAKEFYNMISKCGDCIAKCVADENCRACLGALTALDTRDQVASYRTIVSYESELLKDFSYCILQKNNVFECSADLPTMPKVKPIKYWRGKDLTQIAARSILVGHLNDETAPVGGLKLDISWKVACGANGKSFE
jgi:hypothetical protein